MTGSNILYDNIGNGYNATRQADPYLSERLYELLLGSEKGTCLDIGCGTGNYTIALADRGLKFYGIDPSEEMLRIGRLRRSDITWLKGNAENIPAASAMFGGAMATLTIHHWVDLHGAFTEISRALKPGARLIIFTATPEQMYGYWLNYYFPQMLAKSINQMPSVERITNALTKVGFEIAGTEKYFIAPDLKDLFLYSGKHDPELYFDGNVRKGISSFAALTNREEVNTGLASLRSDIDTGKFKEVKGRYENEKGDYLFIAAIKPLV